MNSKKKNKKKTQTLNEETKTGAHAQQDLDGDHDGVGHQSADEGALQHQGGNPNKVVVAACAARGVVGIQERVHQEHAQASRVCRRKEAKTGRRKHSKPTSAKQHVSERAPPQQQRLRRRHDCAKAQPALRVHDKRTRQATK